MEKQSGCWRMKSVADLRSAGTLLSSAVNTYDEAGNLVKTADANGNYTVDT
jgi:hypothetical protein